MEAAATAEKAEVRKQKSEDDKRICRVTAVHPFSIPA